MSARGYALGAVTVLVALLAAAPVEGQPPTSFPIAECEGLFAQMAKAEWQTVAVPEARQAATPATTNGAPPVDSSFQIFAGKNEDQGEINVVLKRLDQGSTATDFAVTASAPFDKDAGESVFASLAGLSGDVKLSSSVTQHRWQVDAVAYGHALCSECAKSGMTDLLECSRAGLEQRWSAGGRAAADVAAESERLLDTLFGSTPSVLFNFEAAVARAERKFFNDDGSDDAEHRAGFSLTLLGGLVRRHGALYGSIVGKRDYKENDPAQFCEAVPASSLETCKELPRGRAGRVDELVGTLEWRHFFELPAFRKVFQMAVAPSVEIGFDDSDFVLQLPIYFLPSKDEKELTGGIKVGWGSEDDELVAGVFVTKGFSLGPD